jgi:hypothetical protein
MSPYGEAGASDFENCDLVLNRNKENIGLLTYKLQIQWP